MQNLDSVMTKGVELVSESAKIGYASKRMRDKNIGFLVVNAGPNPVGCVTDRDIVVRGIANGLKPDHHRISDVMTRELLTCNSNSSVADALKLMKSRNVYRIVVTDSEKNPVGVVTLGDLSARESGALDLDAALRDFKARKKR